VIQLEMIMTNNELKKFREILRARVIELNSATRRRDAIVIEKTADELENRILATEREVAMRTLESEAVKLRETIAALRRIQDGTYGICMECEEEISAKRLAALPSAVRCIRCQEANDCRCAAKTARPPLAMAA